MNLDQVFYRESSERTHLIPLVRYLKKQEVVIADRYQILDSIHEEIDFVARAYAIKSSKPNQFVHCKGE